MHHYTGSGLDNVFLANGYKIHQTAYGRGISIENIDGLHRAIGQWLIGEPRPLDGAALRFLRLEMDLSQKRFGEIIGVTEQNVRRWERLRLRPISGPADRLIRALYGEYIGHHGSVRGIADRLAEMGRVSPTQRVPMRKTRHGWKVERKAA
jgi:DNA-binding transcriptional regulator YiaG